MIFSNFTYASIIGKILRLPLRLIPTNMVVAVMSGPIKGAKWIKGSGVNGYWLGIYEKKKIKAFSESIKEGDVVFDIGAHVGYYTLVASKIVGSRGRVFAFEPFSRNVDYLKRHIELNDCKNIEVWAVAVSQNEDKSYLKKGGDSFTSQITNEKTDFEIEIVAVDKLIDSNKIQPPTIIKIDVEGDELLVLHGMEKTLRQFHPTVFCALDNPSPAIREKTVKFLKDLEYIIGTVENSEAEIIANK